MEVLAGIVLYNPDIVRLKENIDAIISQTAEIICVDNYSANVIEIESLLKAYASISLVKNIDNLGIAKALNQIMEYGQQQGYEWVLTLDQDSVASAGMVEELCKYCDMDRVALIGPRYIDRNVKIKFGKSDEFEETSKLITSGCLTNTAIWDKVGKFDEELFIDCVDHDLSARVKKHGYRSIQVNRTILLHELGKQKRYKFFGHYIVASNHNPIRVYYYVRNNSLYIYKYKGIIDYKEEKKKLNRYIIKVLLFESEKFNKAISILRGLRDSKKMIKESKKGDRKSL